MARRFLPFDEEEDQVTTFKPLVPAPQQEKPTPTPTPTPSPMDIYSRRPKVDVYSDMEETPEIKTFKPSQPPPPLRIRPGSEYKPNAVEQMNAKIWAGANKPLMPSPYTDISQRTGIPEEQLIQEAIARGGPEAFMTKTFEHGIRPMTSPLMLATLPVAAELAPLLPGVSAAVGAGFGVAGGLQAGEAGYKMLKGEGTFGENLADVALGGTQMLGFVPGMRAARGKYPFGEAAPIKSPILGVETPRGAQLRRQPTQGLYSRLSDKPLAQAEGIRMKDQILPFEKEAPGVKPVVPPTTTTTAEPEKVPKTEREVLLEHMLESERAKILGRKTEKRYTNVEDAVIDMMTEADKATILARAAKKTAQEARAAAAASKRKDTSTVEGRLEDAFNEEEGKPTVPPPPRTTEPPPGYNPRETPKPAGGTSVGMFNLQDFYEKLRETKAGKKTADMFEKAKFHVFNVETGKPVLGRGTAEEARTQASSMNKTVGTDVYQVRANTPEATFEPPVRAFEPGVTPAQRAAQYADKLAERTARAKERRLALAEEHPIEPRSMFEAPTAADLMAGKKPSGPRSTVEPFVGGEQPVAPKPPTTKAAVIRESSPYEIFDHQTGETVGYARTLTGAMNSVDKRDSAYGAVRFGRRANPLYKPTPKGTSASSFGNLQDFYERVRDSETGRRVREKIEEFPAFAKAKGGGLVVDTDIKRAVGNITKDYTSPLPSIMMREGLQNALDAAEKLGAKGEVRVRTHVNALGDKVLEIHDNGSGLDETGLSEKLVRLFASGKEGEAGATGGKGIGSASYIFGGKHFEVDTVAVDSKTGTKYRIKAGGTPNQFLDPVKGSDWEKVPVGKDTPTGTSIKVTLTDEQELYTAKRMLDKVVKHSRNRKSKVISDVHGMRTGEELHKLTGPKTENFPATKDDKLIGDFVTNTKHSEVKVSVPDYNKNTERSTIEAHYLNNGMYQFSEDIYLNEKVKDVPEHVIIDIHPLVDEMHDDYPFINTREDIKKDIREEISKFLDKNIKNPAIETKKNRVQELYDSMTHVTSPGLNRKAVIYDAGSRLTPDEMTSFSENPTTKELVAHYDEVVNDIINATNKPAWATRLEGVGLVLDPGMHGVHIPNPRTKKSTILFNPFIRIESGLSPADSSFKGTITALHEVAHIGDETGTPVTLHPDDLTDPRVGEYLSSYINQIIEHGDTGWVSTGHGMGFVHRLGEVYAGFGTKNTFEAADILTGIVSDPAKPGQYSREVQDLLHLYKESRGRAETTEDLLSGTGVKQENKGPEGERIVPSNRETNRERTPVEEEGGTEVGMFNVGGPLRKLFEEMGIVGEKEQKKAADLLEQAKKEGEKERQQAPVDMSTAEGQMIARLRQNITAEAARKFSLTEWRAKKAAEIHDIQEGGLEGHIKRAEALKGEAEDIRFPPLEMPKDVIDIMIDKSNDTHSGDVFTQHRAAQGIRDINDGKYVPPEVRALVAEVFPEKVRHEIINLYSGIPFEHIMKLYGPTKTLVNKMAGAMYRWSIGSTKTLRAAYDAGVVGIQARGASNTRSYYSAFKKGVQAFNSLEAYNAQQNARYKSKWFKTLKKDMGIHFADLEMNGLEQFGQGNPALENSKLMQKFHRGSIAFLNHIRFENGKLFLKLAKERGENINATELVMKNGKQVTTHPFLESVGKIVNESTGYGTLSEKFHLPQAEKALGHVIWSPRLTASRINYLKLFSKKNWKDPNLRFAQKQRLKSALVVGGTSLVAMKLMEMGGAKAHYDPRDPRFGKVEIGDHVLDTTGGFGALAALAVRVGNAVATQEVMTAKGDKITGWGVPTAKELAQTYFENKMAPTASFASKFASQVNPYTGDPYNIPAEAVSSVIPLVIEDLWDAGKDIIKDGDIRGLLLSIPGFGGANVYRSDKKRTSMAEDILSPVYDAKRKKTFGQENIKPFFKEVGKFF